MSALLLSLCMFTSVIQQIARKEYNKRNEGGAFTFSFGGVFCSLIYFIIMMMISREKINLSLEILIYVAPFSLCYTAAYFFTMRALETGPLSLTSLMISYSLIIPTLYGIIALGEPITVFLIIGIVLLLISLFLVECSGKKGEKHITLKWTIYVLITFFSNGICVCIQKAFQASYRGEDSNNFMVLSLALTSVIFIIVAVMYDKKKVFGYLKKGALWYSLCGFGNGAYNQLAMVLAVTLPASFLYPALSAGGMTLTLLAAVIIYKEKLSLWQKMGFIMGIAAIAVLSV